MGNIMWWRIIVCTLPLSAGGVDHPTKFSKKRGGRGLESISKRGVTFFGGGRGGADFTQKIN